VSVARREIVLSVTAIDTVRAFWEEVWDARDPEAVDRFVWPGRNGVFVTASIRPGQRRAGD